MRDAAADMNSAMREAGQRSGVDFGNAFATGFERQSPRIQSAMLKAADATSKVREETEKLNRAVASGDLDKMTVASNRLTAAHRGHDSALKNLEQVQSLATNGAVTLASTLAEVGAAAGKAAGPAAVGLLVGGLTAAVTAASALAGALGLLPGVAGAAGAGIGTLALGTQGFSDALDAISDPKKFAEAIGALSPNAAKAATDISGLVNGPLADLKRATQDSLFAGIGPQLEQLTSTVGPSVQNMTTTVASAFNSMFSSVTNDPEILSSLQTTMASIGQTFTNLVPAAAPFTEAIAKLAETGSSFLPGLATGITNAANAFSQFITESQNNGSLQQWIQQGIDAFAEFGPIILDVGKAFVEMSGSGQSVIHLVGQLASGFEALAPAINAVLEYGPTFMNVLGPAIEQVTTIVGALGTGFDSLTTIVANAVRSILPMVNSIGTAVSDALAPIRAAAKLAGIQLPEYTPIDPNGPMRAGGAVPKSGPPMAGGSAAADKWLAADQAAHPANANGLPQGAYRRRDGGIGYATPPSLQTGGIPTPLAGQYGPTSGGSTGGLPNPAVAMQGNPLDVLRAAGLTPDSTNYGAAQSVLDRRHDVEEKRAKLNALETSNNATADDLTRARNDVMQAEQDAYKAELSLRDKQIDASQQYAKNLTSTSQTFSDILDKDFGISKGLPGIAENLVKYLGTLATAGFQGQLKAIEAADPQWQARLTAQNGGTTSLFGGQYTGSALGGYPGDAALLANVPSGRYEQTQNADLLQGVGDCTSAVEDLVAQLDGRPTAGRSLSTGNASSWLPQHGFVQGMGGPGDFRVGYNSGHMQATLPAGTPFNWGSNAAAARGGVGGTGADDPSFTSNWYRPVGGPIGSAPIGAPVGPQFSQSGWGPGGLPSMPAGVGGQGLGPGIPTPGMAGQAAGAPVAPVGGPGPGGWQPSATPNQGLGSMAGSAAAMMFPGGGEAAAKAGQLIDRGVKFGGQLAGIGVSGLMETFGLSSPDGGSGTGDLSKSWVGRLASGLAQVKPATPGTAGQAKAPTADQQKHEGSGAPPGPNYSGVVIQGDFVQSPDRKNGQQIMNDLAFQSHAAKSSP